MTDMIAKCIHEARETGNTQFLQNKVEELKKQMAEMMAKHFEKNPLSAFARFFSFKIKIKDVQKYNIEIVSDTVGCSYNSFPEEARGDILVGECENEQTYISKEKIDPLLSKFEKEGFKLKNGYDKELYLEYFYLPVDYKESRCSLLDDVIVQAKSKDVEVAAVKFQQNMVEALKSFFEVNPDEALEKRFLFFISEVNELTLEPKISNIYAGSKKYEKYDRNQYISMNLIESVCEALGFKYYETISGSVIEYNLQ